MLLPRIWAAMLHRETQYDQPPAKAFVEYPNSAIMTCLELRERRILPLVQVLETAPLVTQCACPDKGHLLHNVEHLGTEGADQRVEQVITQRLKHKVYKQLQVSKFDTCAPSGR